MANMSRYHKKTPDSVPKQSMIRTSTNTITFFFETYQESITARIGTGSYCTRFFYKQMDFPGQG